MLEIEIVNENVPVLRFGDLAFGELFMFASGGRGTADVLCLKVNGYLEHKDTTYIHLKAANELYGNPDDKVIRYKGRLTVQRVEE